MFRTAAILAFFALASASSRAQTPTLPAGRVRTPVRDAGMLHLATGTWSTPTESRIGNVVYNNDAPQRRFLSIQPGQSVADFGIVPFEMDEANSRAGQLVNGFQFAYVTREVQGDFAYVISFYDDQVPCDLRAASNALARIVLDDLPGAPRPGMQACWQVAVDLRFTEHDFFLNGASRMHFAFGVELTNNDHGAAGPIMAGDPAGVFGDPAGVGAGTDHDGSLGLPGTGLGTDDSYWLRDTDGQGTCVNGVPNAPISFASFHLQLYADSSNASTAGTGIGTNYCEGWAETEDLIYWTTNAGRRILSTTPSGDQVDHVLVMPDASPFAIEIDVIGRKMYWTENPYGSGSAPKIRRADLNGLNSEDLVGADVLSFPAGIALDVRGQKMYWGDRDAPHVGRANLDGSDVEILIPGCRALGIDLDLPQAKMYWAEESNMIRRANLDGSGVETLLSGLNSPNDISIDSARRKMYWTEDGQMVKRANLDGTAIETIYSNGGYPFGIAVDSANGKVYWSSIASPPVSRSNLDGSGYEVVVSNGSQTGFGIAVAPAISPPGHILAFGSTSVADNDLTLVATGVPADAAGLFFYGERETFVPLGHGFRCIGGRVQRLWPPQRSDHTGVASLPVDLTSEPAYNRIFNAAPVTMNFQYWHRFGGSSSLTDATRVHFVK